MVDSVSPARMREQSDGSGGAVDALRPRAGDRTRAGDREERRRGEGRRGEAFRGEGIVAGRYNF